MRKILQSELLSLSGASQRDVENWMGRQNLSTKYEKTVQGRPRRFTRDNALEIVLMTRLVKNGVAPAVAAERLANLFKKFKEKKPHGWALFVNDERFPLDFIVSDQPPSAELMSSLKGCVVVNVAELADHVDEFFEKEGEASDD